VQIVFIVFELFVHLAIMIAVIRKMHLMCVEFFWQSQTQDQVLSIMVLSRWEILFNILEVQR